MADVKVGQVRRGRPHGGRYFALPFVVRYVGTKVLVTASDGTGARWRDAAAVAACPLWPSEHEQWKDARGYEVKHA